MKHLTPFMKMSFYSTVVLTVLWMILPFAWAQETTDHRPYKLRFGSLEVNPNFERRYVFRWNDSEEVFDLSMKGRLKYSGIQFPGLPNLEMVGVRTKSEKTLYFGKVFEQDFFVKFPQNFPNEELAALVFRGVLEEELIILMSGKTPVCRIDVQQQGIMTSLWANIPALNALK